ncbi:hypothetical protein C461_11683 [Halorubrum aidingense JCM 13560]|uniref:DUF8215 domain-containing protein n=1 Tax=Halorubrum aidingense JCM 13560 TaxID=1230454 RepID=M0PCY7_9EURY|nr:hypothetical protein [Halorubrum aidingense]EMA66700.1 hypothetical protein C461_11683 [Halorubrum aidingense JCM 13560]
MSGWYTRFFDWLEGIFFGGMELSFLSSPGFALVVVFQDVYPDAVSLAGLLAIGTGSVALAEFRNRTIDVGAWPQRSELTSLPLRVGYFSLLFLASSMGVAAVVTAVDNWWLTLLGAVVQVGGLAAFPTAYHLVYGEPLGDSALRA